MDSSSCLGEIPESSLHGIYQSKCINALPDEVLEFILSMVPPYQDLQACMCVCRRWYDCSKAVMRKTSNKLEKAIAEFKIQWKNITPVDMAPTITKRFSHSACIYENSMYIFGGCTTNSTAFNDLWRFDLSKRQWIRPLAMGTYPVPKAYSSMVRYKDNLVLYGGWHFPCPSTYYSASFKMYNDVHFYNVTSNRWILINANNSPPQVFGHSAAVIGDQMIVFGGLSWRENGICCLNEVWVLDLIKMSWRKQDTSTPRPPARNAPSLVVLDESTVMILGGVQSLSNRFTYNDCWILKMKGPVWTWKEMLIKNKEWAAANIWCNPACRVGDKVVSLSRCKNGRWGGARPLVTSAIRITTTNQPAHIAERVEREARRPVDRDHNVNGTRGALPQRNYPTANNRLGTVEPRAGPSRESEVCIETTPQPCVAARGQLATLNVSKDKSLAAKKTLKMNGNKIVRQLQEANKYRMAAFACDIQSPPPENDLINQRQIAHFARQIAHFGRPIDNRPSPEPENPPKKQKRNTLTMHVLDISQVLNEGLNQVSWLHPGHREVSGAPEELVMYSLVRGNGELIMFGGVPNDIDSLHNLPRSQQYLISNSLHFITPPRDVI